MRRLAGLVAGLLTISAGIVSAQTLQHAVDPAAIAAALQEQDAQRVQDLAAVREALGRAPVAEAARHLGVDLARVDAALASMTDRDLAAVAHSARRVTQALTGGASTVTISTTTIIIGLLVLILIIVAVK